MVNAAHTYQVCSTARKRMPDAQALALPPDPLRGASAGVHISMGVCAGLADLICCPGAGLAGCGHIVDQGQIIDLARQIFDARQHAIGVSHAHARELVQIEVNRTNHRCQPGLGRAFHALASRFEGRHQGLQAAGKFGLLLGQADAGIDIGHQILIARARHALHQFFKLIALQTEFTHAGFHHGDAGGAVAGQVLRVFGQGACLNRLRSGLGRLAGQLLLHIADPLPQNAAANQRGHGDTAQSQHQCAR